MSALILKMNNLKKRSYSWFSKSCIDCLNKNQCISAGAFHQCMRHYFLHLKGYEYPANEAMIKGKEFHENFLKEFKTIDEYGLKDFLIDLPKGESITLKELPICSPLYGLKGIIDKVEFKYHPKKEILKIVITELKSSFNKKYIFQLASYGLMLSDSDCMVGYMKEDKRLMQKLYPKNIKVTISLILKIKDAEGVEELFLFRNLLTEWGRGISMGINNKKKSYRHFHQAGLYFLHEIPPPKICWDNCPYYPICKKYEYNSHKSKQRYFGKKQVLIKTKRKIIG